MEYMYHARRAHWPDGTAAISVVLPGTAGAETLLDIEDPTVIESDLDREWIIVSEKVPGSWPDGDPSEEVMT